MPTAAITIRHSIPSTTSMLMHTFLTPGGRLRGSVRRRRDLISGSGKRSDGAPKARSRNNGGCRDRCRNAKRSGRNGNWRRVAVLRVGRIRGRPDKPICLHPGRAGPAIASQRDSGALVLQSGPARSGDRSGKRMMSVATHRRGGALPTMPAPGTILGSVAGRRNGRVGRGRGCGSRLAPAEDATPIAQNPGKRERCRKTGLPHLTKKC